MSLSIGIIGEYLSSMFDELKRRPLYIVDDAVGLDAGDGSRARDTNVIAVGRGLYPRALFATLRSSKH